MKRALLLLLCACDGCGPKAVRESIAICSAAHGEVRFHPQDDWVWNTLSVGDGLSAGDWVRTGAEAYAQVRFQKNGSEIAIDPSSTIILQLPEETAVPEPLIARIKVEAGVVHGKVESAQSQLEVHTPEGRTIRVEPEKGKEFGYRVTVNKDGIMELAVTEGRASISGVDGANVELGSGQAHDLVAGALVGETVELPRFPDLISPGINANVLYREALAIDLVWSSVPVAREYRLQVALDRSFINTIVDRTIPKPASRFEVGSPTSYHWRVASRAKDGRLGEYGFAREIRVTETLRDLLIAPSDETLIKVGSEKPVVEFAWEAVVPPKRYRLVVAQDRDLTRKTFELKTADQRVSVRSLGPGTYWWGVYSEDPETSLFEKPRRLKIKRDVGLSTPDKVTFE